VGLIRNHRGHELAEEEPKERSIFDSASSSGLFVGISTFEDERIPEVPFAVDDAVDLAYLFVVELKLVLPESIVLLLAGEPRKPKSADRLKRLIELGARRQAARQREIYRFLSELTRTSSSQGIMLVTVATHGLSDLGGDFLVASDSLRDRTLRTGVAVTELFDEVSRSGAQRRLVLLDACRERLSQGTRGGDDSAMAPSFANAIANAKGLVILSGATLGGFAYDDTSRMNGVFTAAVLDGLGGEAPADQEGWITVRTLADFVQQRVVAWVRRNRPDHATKSLGIGRQIEATADALPLTLHPQAAQARLRYRSRRAAALERVKDNQGKILSGAFWDEIVARLPPDSPSPETDRLLDEIEALDGTERSQRSLRDFLREGTPLLGLPLAPSAEEPRSGQDATHPRRPIWADWGGRVLAGMIIVFLGGLVYNFIAAKKYVSVPEPITIEGLVADNSGAPLKDVKLVAESGEFARTNGQGAFVLSLTARPATSGVAVTVYGKKRTFETTCFVGTPCRITLAALIPAAALTKNDKSVAAPKSDQGTAAPKNDQPTAAPKNDQRTAEPKNAAEAAAPLVNARVILDTTKGRIVIELYPDKAPKTVKNFLSYVKAGFYNGTIFHRVIPGFMVQGGGFTPDMTEKPTRPPIQDEADNGLQNQRGALAMARTSDPNSAGAQFFINVANNNSLNFRSKTTEGWGYAVFGNVVEGMDVVDAIVQVPTTTKGPYQDVPVQPVVIQKATISTQDQ